MQISEWLGSIFYYSLNTTLANHNGTDVGVNIRCCDSNPGVLISDNEYFILGVGGIDQYGTLVFREKLLQYYYIPTTGVAELQACLSCEVYNII